MKRVILLDADIPIFKYAAVNQADIQWDDDCEMVSVVPPFEVVADQLDAEIANLKAHLNADRLIVCLSEPDREKNWRKAILPSYKDNRKDTKSPIYRQALSDYLEENYECFKRPSLEGDDVMGILATSPTIVKGKKVIVSIDKDMQTIPTRKHRGSENWLYNPNKDKKPRKVTEEQADWFWMYQTIIGDTTDGYKGLPGRGPKFAQEWLGPPEEGYLTLWWDLVIEAYEQKGLALEDALVQARVARICRVEDYNFETKEVIPWEG